MLTLEARPYAGEADLPAIVDLINACEVVDKLDQGTTLDVLRMEFNDPWLDTQHNVRLWHAADGTLVGEANIDTPQRDGEVEGRLFMRVHPQHRDGDLAETMLEWAETRMREIKRERAVPARLRISVREDQMMLRALVERFGFDVRRSVLEMACPLDDALPQPQLPAGFTVRETDGERDAENWVEMFNQTWLDHWNGHTWTVEHFNNLLTDPDERADLNLIALAPDGTFAAFCWCRIAEEENKRSGQNNGYVDVLGTRRGYRKQGLGRALLLTGLHRLKAAGAETAKLGVDAESLTGATRLYESIGFRTEQMWQSWMKDL